MKIHSMQLGAFMLLDEVEVELPPRGIVLITGENGTGKSTLIESIPAALYGKTLRGTPWWREDAESFVTLRCGDGMEITRTRKGAKNKLSLEGIEHGECDTATKTQDFLNKLIPSFEVWKKTSVFSSAAVEGDHFTSGADGDRKRLLEAVLAIEKFDFALALCREDMKRAIGVKANAESTRELAATKMEAEERRRDEAVARRKDFKDSAPPSDKGDAIKDQLSKLRPKLDELINQDRDAGIKVGRQDADLRTAKNKMDLLGKGKCPTCSQTIPTEMITELKEKIAALVAATKYQCAASDTNLDGVRAELEELREAVNELEAQRRLLAQHAEQHAQRRAENDRNEKIIGDATLASTRHLTDKSNAIQTIKRTTSELALLSAVESVLGLKGVRAHVLAHTLLGLAQVANKWLSKMDSDITIALSPYTEKKTGGHSDAISVAIEGAGAGYGYAACSAGQRRRVDVALILGLATLASVAHGVTGGILCFDEVFDVLDTAGVQGVATALHELSADRCVVVVSHSTALGKALAIEKHLLVEAGSVWEV